MSAWPGFWALTVNDAPFGFYEFFAGGGMARLGLGSRWECLFANELSPKKAAAYRANFGRCEELRVDDVANLKASDLRSGAALSWASFPCQDLSLAGNGVGLRGRRSGTFVSFWNLMAALAEGGRPVPVVVLENVPGALTANRGHDFQTLLTSLVDAGYRAGALLLNAVHFIPQLRLRLFVAVASGIEVPPALLDAHPPSAKLGAIYHSLPDRLREHWLWWRLPAPPQSTSTIRDLLEADPASTRWHRNEETQRLLALMSEGNLRKVHAAQTLAQPVAGTVYKRVRTAPDGLKMQRAEVRFDGVAGCLRTPTGGSSRQTLLLVERERIRSRLLSPREAARLMGLPDSYTLPANANDAYHLAGDGLVVPVVRWLESHLLYPLAQSLTKAQSQVA